MVRSIASKGLNWDEFVTQYGDNERYELIDGELIDMEPTGPHEQVAALVSRKLNVEIDRGDLPYFIPHRCLIRPLGIASAFRPDVVVLDSEKLKNEPLWAREPVITMGGATAKLVVEVVSTNWQNDYARKYEDYEALGISEYWIVDYLGIGGKYYIGSSKQPTITICNLVDGEYHKMMFRSGDLLQSFLFPNIAIAADKLFAFGVNQQDSPTPGS